MTPFASIKNAASFRSPARTSSGYRVFAETEIQDLHFIRRLQQSGFSLKEIKGMVALRQADHACPQVRDLIKSKITELRLRMTALRSDLERPDSRFLDHLPSW